MTLYVCGGQRTTCGSHVYYGIECGSSSLAAAFTSRAIYPALNYISLTLFLAIQNFNRSLPKNTKMREGL